MRAHTHTHTKPVRRERAESSGYCSSNDVYEHSSTQCGRRPLLSSWPAAQSIGRLQGSLSCTCQLNPLSPSAPSSPVPSFSLWLRFAAVYRRRSCLAASQELPLYARLSVCVPAVCSTRIMFFDAVSSLAWLACALQHWAESRDLSPEPRAVYSHCMRLSVSGRVEESMSIKASFSSQVRFIGTVTDSANNQCKNYEPNKTAL